MPKLTGLQAIVAIMKSTVWGTAVAAGAGDVTALDSYSRNDSSDELEGNNLGTGLAIKQDITIGNTEFSINLDMIAGYENKADVIFAQLLGDPQAPVEQNAGENDQLHQIFLSPNANNNGYLTIAEKVTTTDVIESPSVSVTSLTISHDEPTSELAISVEGVSNTESFETPVNDIPTLDAATRADATKILVTTNSIWLINEQGAAALTSSDKICPISATITFQRPQEIQNTVCGQDGSSEPSVTDFFTGQLTLTVPFTDNINFWIGAKNQTTYKAVFEVEGSQIGAGENKRFSIYLPRLKQLANPERPLDAPNDLPVTYTFEILGAIVAPPGMDSNLPYIEIVNERATSY